VERFENNTYSDEYAEDRGEAGDPVEPVVLVQGDDRAYSADERDEEAA